MKLRQIALVARELDPVVDDLCAVLGIDVCYNDPGVGVFGLKNALMPLGETFLEVVCPKEEGTSAGRLLDRRDGDGGYMVIFQTDDLARERRRMEDLGVRIVWEGSHDAAATIHLHPRDVGGAIVSLDWMNPPESWRWAGPNWREHIRTDTVRAITGAELQADNPAEMVGRWAQVLGAEPEGAGPDTYELDVNGATIRFVPVTDGRGEGLRGLMVDAADGGRILAAAEDRGLEHTGDAVQMCGTWFHLQ